MPPLYEISYCQNKSYPSIMYAIIAPFVYIVVITSVIIFMQELRGHVCKLFRHLSSELGN